MGGKVAFEATLVHLTNTWMTGQPDRQRPQVGQLLSAWMSLP